MCLIIPSMPAMHEDPKDVNDPRLVAKGKRP